MDEVPGSIPGADPVIHDVSPYGAVVTHLTCNEKIRGSNPRAGYRMCFCFRTELGLLGVPYTPVCTISRAEAVLIILLCAELTTDRRGGLFINMEYI